MRRAWNDLSADISRKKVWGGAGSKQKTRTTYDHILSFDGEVSKQSWSIVEKAIEEDLVLLHTRSGLLWQENRWGTIRDFDHQIPYRQWRYAATDTKCRYVPWFRTQKFIRSLLQLTMGGRDFRHLPWSVAWYAVDAVRMSLAYGSTETGSMSNLDASATRLVKAIRAKSIVWESFVRNQRRVSKTQYYLDLCVSSFPRKRERILCRKQVWALAGFTQAHAPIQAMVGGNQKWVKYKATDLT